MNRSLELVKTIAEDRYCKEHQRNERINNSLSIPIAIIVALIGVVGFFLINITFKIINTPGAWVVFFLFVGSLMILMKYLFRAIHLLGKVFLGMIYAHMPAPKEINSYAESLERYYQFKKIKSMKKSRKI